MDTFPGVPFSVSSGGVPCVPIFIFARAYLSNSPSFVFFFGRSWRPT